MPRPSNPEDAMRGFLQGQDPNAARFRKLMRRVPRSPRCKLCSVPFEGPGGAVLRHVGFARFAGNPSLCSNCISSLNKMGVLGAEIPVTLLFADIRGSTTIGEQSTPTEFRAFLDGFYRHASDAVLENDGMVDKFVGDEVIGLFFAGISGQDHAAPAIRAAQALLEAVGAADASPRGPIPVGAAVHTGQAFVGSTGAGGAVSDFTALGDAVNTTARLASAAAPGELLVSMDAVLAAGIDPMPLERRSLDVRGRSGSIEVVALRPPTTARVPTER